MLIVRMDPDEFYELIRGEGGELSSVLLVFYKKIPFEFFWVCLKFCSFLDFEFIEKCYKSFL